MLPCESVENIDELVQALGSFGFPGVDPFRHALFYVTAEHGQADPVERRLGGRKLLENFNAEPRLFDHAADSANLSFYTVQAGDEGLLLGGVQHTGVYATLEIVV